MSDIYLWLCVPVAFLGLLFSWVILAAFAEVGDYLTHLNEGRDERTLDREA